ncbi:MAG: CehA/McbA family metallohydrolase [Planctomycetes bacterium]|nr:CehA/McbA family metallohydrolase [Planctomycetota bacterium]
MGTLPKKPLSRAWLFPLVLILAASATQIALPAPALPPVEVEGQPLAANATRLAEALHFLGAPLPQETASALQEAARARDARKIQELLDPRVLLVVTVSPEARVKVSRGPATATLQQGGWVPMLVKVINDSTAPQALHLSSPQAGPVFSGGAGGSARGDKDHFLQAELYTSPPMTARLSGLKVEYVLALIYSSEAGHREATLGFDVGQGTQDLGFRGEVPILFDVRPAIPVKLSVTDEAGRPTVARFLFHDRAGHIYPPQAKRLAPDLFFQQQIYRPDGGTVLLPPGELTMVYGRGPEYRQRQRQVTIPDKGEATLSVRLERWINPQDYGFYSGDHHIHAAGCAHYTDPTQGVLPQDMFLHVKGEGLNVGCNLTWGPCFEFQRQFFTPAADPISEPFTVLKYDLEISGFGSQALGHVCLLNLKDQTYPGSNGTKTKGWPTWTTPVLRWAKQQGAVTGYAHSANGLNVDPPAAAHRLLVELDANHDGRLSPEEAGKGLLPEDFAAIDTDKDNRLTEPELTASIARVADRLPNLAIPEMNGIGAQEICVTVSQGLCDFISAMDTARVPEWNCWYHLLNCGFPLKASGETDFPCISGSRVGQGRVYVHLGRVDRVDFAAWCRGLAQGRSYISDGYAHALDFQVNGKAPGHGDVSLDKPGRITVRAKVAFAAEVPLGTATGGAVPAGRTRKVALVVNGMAAAFREVPADDQVHELIFEIPLERSSWVALRSYPQLHTNPVNVLIGGKPIRASRKSALWCIGTIEQLWRVRGPGIAASEREEAHRTFLGAIECYRKIAAEAPEGS